MYASSTFRFQGDRACRLCIQWYADIEQVGFRVVLHNSPELVICGYGRCDAVFISCKVIIDLQQTCRNSLTRNTRRQDPVHSSD